MSKLNELTITVYGDFKDEQVDDTVEKVCDKISEIMDDAIALMRERIKNELKDSEQYRVVVKG